MTDPSTSLLSTDNEADESITARGEKTRQLSTRACDACRARRRKTQPPAVISPELHVESPTHYEEETLHAQVTTPIVNSHSALTFETSPNAPSPSRPLIHSHVAHFNHPENVELFDHQFQTDDICPRGLFMTIMTDYIDHIYPLVPVVHLPTFRADLATNKDVSDLDTLLLFVSIASLTVGLLPSKFDSYHALAARFGTRTAMISHCSQTCIRLRPADYWDHISHRKWATAYCLSIGAFQVGQINQSRMFEAESMQLARLLGLHIVLEYEGLNPIETQLRKKSFWLQLYTFAHSKIQPGRCNYLTYLDNYTIRDVNFAALEPLNIVDEKITETGIVGQLPSTPSVGLPNNTDSADDAPFHSTTVFIMASRAFLLGMRESMVNDGCNCGFGRSPEERLSKLRDLLDQLRYILDGLPTHMRQWGPGDNYQPFDSNERRQGAFTDANIEHLQNESTRANLHVSHLWLQNFLLDKMDVVLQEMKDREGDESYVATQLKQNWRDREDVARQLLHILHSIPHAYLEPNGLYLIYKVRSIASSLLNCPFEMDRQLSRRVSEYIQEFTKVLSYLDRSEIVNTDGLRSWIDEDFTVADKDVVPRASTILVQLCLSAISSCAFSALQYQQINPIKSVRMKPLHLFMAFIGLSINPVSARCFKTGAKWQDRAAARQHAVDACKGDGVHRGAFEGTFAAGQAVNKCIQHSPTQKIEFMIQNVDVFHASDLDSDYCVYRLQHEIDSCARGGASIVGDWIFRADPMYFLDVKSMATAQEIFRVESASEWAKKMGITTWTKFHSVSQPEQSIFTPLDTWDHSIHQPYYGRIIESSQDYFLAVGWQTEEQWDKFKLSPEHQQLMANLTTNNAQLETETIIFTANMFAIGYTSNVELFTVYWPASITHEAQTAIWKTKQLVHTPEGGLPNPLCYTKKPMFGWIDGQKDWKGESAIASIWCHKWKNRELEQKYKTTEKRLDWGNNGRYYRLAVEAFQDDLKSLGAIGWESVHVAFERVQVVKEDALARNSRLRLQAARGQSAT
ncbi:hypothetical protein F52700_4067 [Fusarium sp. NRRL 52700]|nr:hypothetical protein F52700_4067 [Fusarium sp. NRRL 52700]